MSTNMQDNTSALVNLDAQLRSLNSYSSLRMPIIELTSISTDGTRIPSSEHPHQFNLRIVGGGSIREGDEIQLCYRTLTSKKRIFKDQAGVEHQSRTYKYKYRCFCSKIVEDPSSAIAGGIYIKLAPEWDVDDAGHVIQTLDTPKAYYALIHNQRNNFYSNNNSSSLGYIYLRIKRKITTDNDENNATVVYSNIIPIGKTSTPTGEIRYYI